MNMIVKSLSIVVLFSSAISNVNAAFLYCPKVLTCENSELSSCTFKVTPNPFGPYVSGTTSSLENKKRDYAFKRAVAWDVRYAGGYSFSRVTCEYEYGISIATLHSFSFDYQLPVGTGRWEYGTERLQDGTKQDNCNSINPGDCPFLDKKDFSPK